MKCLATISNDVGSRLIATAVITDSLYIPPFTSGWALPYVWLYLALAYCYPWRMLLLENQVNYLL